MTAPVEQRVGAFRRFSALAGLFLVLEALLGAGLVLFDYVAHNVSAGRAAYMSAHLANTMVLLAMIAMTAWSARVTAPVISLRNRPKLALSALPVAILLGISGALAALGDTLFPAASVEAGIRQELAPSAHALMRLRLLHPAVALAAGVFLLLAGLLWIALVILVAETYSLGNSALLRSSSGLRGR